MCLYIGAEVILSNLLNYYSKSNEGIDFSDIEKYCEAIKNALATDKSFNIKFISFHLNDSELENSLQLYPGVFKKFMGKYYKGINFSTCDFEARVKPEISSIMKITAEAL